MLARLAAHALHGRVLFTESFPAERMVELYRSALVTLVPSICLEGTSLAALESMASGTPVVATAVGGLKDLPCVLAPPEADALARALRETIEARDEVAKRQREAVLARFTRAAWSEAWLRAVAA